MRISININRLKRKNQLIVSMQKKHLTKFNTYLWLNTQNNRSRGDLSLFDKEHYKKPTGKIVLNGEILNAFPLRSETRQGCILLPFLCNTVLEVQSCAISQEKKIKDIMDWKGRNKTVSICIQHDYLHRKSQGIYKNNPGISEFSKDTEFK